jgi:hypothetical protein
MREYACKLLTTSRPGEGRRPQGEGPESSRSTSISAVPLLMYKNQCRQIRHCLQQTTSKRAPTCLRGRHLRSPAPLDGHGSATLETCSGPSADTLRAPRQTRFTGGSTMSGRGHDRVRQGNGGPSEPLRPSRDTVSTPQQTRFRPSIDTVRPLAQGGPAPPPAARRPSSDTVGSSAGSRERAGGGPRPFTDTVRLCPAPLHGHGCAPCPSARSCRTCISAAGATPFQPPNGR